MEKLDNYEDLFIKKGYIPLDKIVNSKDKITCIDEEGYKYYASYDMVRDKRTKHLDRWRKENPYKSFNMRLYASKIQENCVILSSDEDLINSSHAKIEFICPQCQKTYKKKWCHWLQQPKNRHFCPKCMIKESNGEFLVKEWLESKGIEYKREFWFEDCKDIRVLPFDFMINRHGQIYLIEVDGCQHFYKNLLFNNLTLEERQRKDNIKTEYCKEKGYILLRLPFWDFERDTYIKKLNLTFFGME